jgi:hypothetical protein
VPILGKLWIDDEGMHFEMDEGMTADDRFINRSSITGQFVSDQEADCNPETTVTEEVKHNSPWLKEWIRLGEMMEGYAPYRAEMINYYTVDAVIHAQMLKRVG